MLGVLVGEHIPRTRVGHPANPLPATVGSGVKEEAEEVFRERPLRIAVHGDVAIRYGHRGVENVIHVAGTVRVVGPPFLVDDLAEPGVVLIVRIVDVLQYGVKAVLDEVRRSD
jgi:hypothetical protein